VKKRTKYDVATADRCPATRQMTRATRRVPPPTPRRREETYQVRRGNGRPVPGNTPEDVGNVPSAISHSSTRPRQHRGSDLPQLGRVTHRTEGGAATAPDTAFHLGSTRHLIEANIYSPRQDPGMWAWPCVSNRAHLSRRAVWASHARSRARIGHSARSGASQPGRGPDQAGELPHMSSPAPHACSRKRLRHPDSPGTPRAR